MKSTELLNIKDNYYLEHNTIIIHPNVGIDIDLIQTVYKVKIFFNCLIEEFNKENGFVEGQLFLKNNCVDNTVEISHKNWVKLGKPNKVKIFLENDKVLISSFK